MISFKIDENIPKSSKEIFFEHSIQCFDVYEEKLNGKKDSIVLNTVIKENLVFVTLDYDFSDIRQYNYPFSGVIILNPMFQSINNVNNLIKKLLIILNKVDFNNSICILSENNIRIRKISF